MANKRTPQTDADRMSLPVGKTCGDCAHSLYCSQFLGSSFDRASEVCDWSPSRFYERKPAEAGEN